METVIKKLSEIEVAAKRIMDDANMQVQNLDTAMQQESAAFDARVERDTHQRLEELRSRLRKENDDALKKLKDDTQSGLASIKQHFSQHHSELADQIVQKITGA